MDDRDLDDLDPPDWFDASDAIRELLIAGDYRRALEACEPWVAELTEGTDVTIRAGLAHSRMLCFIGLGELERAVTEATALLALYPTDRECRSARAELALVLERVPEAKHDADVLVDLDPAIVGYRALRAEILRRLGQPEAADEDERIARLLYAVPVPAALAKFFEPNREYPARRQPMWPRLRGTRIAPRGREGG